MMDAGDERIIAGNMTTPAALTLVDCDTGEALPLESLSCEVEIFDNLVSVVLTTQFRNPFNRDLKAEITFPLDELATVCSYAVDVDGVLIEAAIVEKEIGRKVVQEEVVEQQAMNKMRYKEDKPAYVKDTAAVLEQVSDGRNSYTTTIYPVPASGTKTVRLGYATKLSDKGEFPLAFCEPSLGHFLFKCQVGGLAKPRLLTTGLPPHSFQSSGARVWSLKCEHTGPLDTTLVVTPPPAPAHQLLVGSYKDEYYFALGLDLKVPPTLPISQLDRVTIFWDVSSSMAGQHVSLLAGLKELLGGLPVRACDLYFVRNIAELGGSDLAPQRCIEAVGAAVYDGATDLSSLPVGRPASLAFLFTDGLATLGGPKLGFDQPTSNPLHIVNSSDQAAHALLQGWASRQHGQYWNLARSSADQLVRHVTRPSFSFLDCQASPAGSLGELLPAHLTAVTEAQRFWIVGRIREPQQDINLTLSFGFSSQPELTLQFSLTDIYNSRPSYMLARFWGERKIAFITATREDTEATRAELLDLARHFSILTANASLLVLERLEQYLKYSIRPPAHLTQLCRLYDLKHSRRDRPALGKQEVCTELWANRRALYDRVYDGSPQEPLLHAARNSLARADRQQADGPVGLSALLSLVAHFLPLPEASLTIEQAKQAFHAFPAAVQAARSSLIAVTKELSAGSSVSNRATVSFLSAASNLKTSLSCLLALRPLPGSLAGELRSLADTARVQAPTPDNATTVLEALADLLAGLEELSWVSEDNLRCLSADPALLAAQLWLLASSDSSPGSAFVVLSASLRQKDDPAARQQIASVALHLLTRASEAAQHQGRGKEVEELALSASNAIAEVRRSRDGLDALESVIVRTLAFCPAPLGAELTSAVTGAWLEVAQGLARGEPPQIPSTLALVHDLLAPSTRVRSGKTTATTKAASSFVPLTDLMLSGVSESDLEQRLEAVELRLLRTPVLAEPLGDLHQQLAHHLLTAESGSQIRETIKAALAASQPANGAAWPFADLLEEACSALEQGSTLDSLLPSLRSLPWAASQVQLQSYLGDCLDALWPNEQRYRPVCKRVVASADAATLLAHFATVRFSQLCSFMYVCEQEEMQFCASFVSHTQTLSTAFVGSSNFGLDQFSQELAGAFTAGSAYVASHPLPAAQLQAALEAARGLEKAGLALAPLAQGPSPPAANVHETCKMIASCFARLKVALTRGQADDAQTAELTSATGRLVAAVSRVWQLCASHEAQESESDLSAFASVDLASQQSILALEGDLAAARVQLLKARAARAPPAGAIDDMLASLTQDSPVSHCGACNEAIVGRSVYGAGQAWHPHHFRCSDCQRPLEGSYFECNAQLYCPADYAKCYGQAPRSGKQPAPPLKRLPADGLDELLARRKFGGRHANQPAAKPPQNLDELDSLMESLGGTVAKFENKKAARAGATTGRKMTTTGEQTRPAEKLKEAEIALIETQASVERAKQQRQPDDAEDQKGAMQRKMLLLDRKLSEVSGYKPDAKATGDGLTKRSAELKKKKQPAGLLEGKGKKAPLEEKLESVKGSKEKDGQQAVDDEKKGPRPSDLCQRLAKLEQSLQSLGSSASPTVGQTKEEKEQRKEIGEDKLAEMERKLVGLEKLGSKAVPAGGSEKEKEQQAELVRREVELNDLFARLGKIECLDGIAWPLMNAGSTGGWAPAPPRDPVELKAAMVDLQTRLFDPNIEERDSDDLNIQLEKLLSEYERTAEFQMEQKAQREAWLAENGPLNKAAHQRLTADRPNAERVNKFPALRLLLRTRGALLKSMESDFRPRLDGLSLDELRALHWTMPEFRKDQRVQQRFVEDLEEAINISVREPKPAPAPRAAGRKPVVVFRAAGGGASTDLMAEVVAKNGLASRRLVSKSPAKKALPPLPTSSLPLPPLPTPAGPSSASSRITAILVKPTFPVTTYSLYLEKKKAGASTELFVEQGCGLYQTAPLLALRILSNLAEFATDVKPLRTLAYYCEALGALPLAEAAYRRALVLRPEEPQSHRDLALILLQSSQRSGLGHLRAALLGQWSRRFALVEMPLLADWNWALATAKRLGWEEAEATEAGTSWLSSCAGLEYDLRVTLRWDTDLADCELLVDEPGPAAAPACTPYNNHTANGGVNGRNFTHGYGPNEYFLRRAPAGTYCIRARLAHQPAPAPVTACCTLYCRAGPPLTTTQLLPPNGDSVTLATVWVRPARPMQDLAEFLDSSVIFP